MRVTVSESGTGGGFAKFLRGKTDTNDASRPISVAEWEAASDLQINRLHSENLDMLVTHAQECPEQAEARMHLISASKALERIADHIKNIAGNIVFLVEGIDLRRTARAEPASNTPQSGPW